MLFMLLIYRDEALPVDRSKEAMERWNALESEMRSCGVYKAGGALRGAETATSVRVRNHQRLRVQATAVTTRERLCRFYLLDCEDLDEAIDWAAKIPYALDGTVEIRPVHTVD